VNAEGELLTNDVRPGRARRPRSGAEAPPTEAKKGRKRKGGAE
jgi:hypothetical protein